MAAAEARTCSADRPIGALRPPRRSASSAGGRAARSSAARSGSARSADRRRARSISVTAKAASSCGTTMPARSRGSFLHPGLELPVVDRARQRGGEVEIALLHAAAAQRHQHAVSRRRWGRGAAGASARDRSRAGPAPERRRPACPTPSCADRRAGPTGPGADARRRSSCARASAPAGTDAGPPACDRPDGCRNRRSRGAARRSACRSGTFIARPPGLPPHYRPSPPRPANADRSRAGCRSGSLRTVASDSPSGSTSSPSKCQCG